MLKLRVDEGKDIRGNMSCVMALKLPLNSFDLILKSRLNFSEVKSNFIEL